MCYTSLYTLYTLHASCSLSKDPVHLSTSQCVYPFCWTRLSISLTTCLDICICLSTCLYSCLLVSLSSYLSIHQAACVCTLNTSPDKGAGLLAGGQSTEDTEDQDSLRLTGGTPGLGLSGALDQLAHCSSTVSLLMGRFLLVVSQETVEVMYKRW